MPEQPIKVSVLLTSYNLVDYIDESIGSIVRMDMPFGWELIIGDDGSNDGTVDKIKQWIEKFPQNIRLMEIDRTKDTVKTGSRAARNRAMLLENARGEYINYLDGDDCYLGTEKFKTQVSILDNPDNADCSCCGHNHIDYFIPQQLKQVYIKEGQGDQKFNIRQYWYNRYFHTNTILFRKECKELLLQPLYRGFLNDNFITFLLLQKGKIYYSDHVWNQYNRTGEGLWTGHSAVYGDFRNMHLYDLELKVRPDLSKLIMNRHKFSIRNIHKNYKQGMEEEIQPLLKGLNPGVFKYTLLLAKLDGLSLKEKWAKFMLFKKADASYMVSRVKKLLAK